MESIMFLLVTGTSGESIMILLVDAVMIVVVGVFQNKYTKCENKKRSFQVGLSRGARRISLHHSVINEVWWHEY